MSIFALSDTHLSLETDKPMDIFGSRWLDHHEKIREGWNRVVSDSDTVVIAGDISWAMTLEEARKDFLFLESLNGKKLISKGNHDYWWSTSSKINAFFEKEGIDSISLLHNNAYLAENKLICGTRGWYSDPKVSPRNADYEKIVARECLRLEMSLNEGEKLSSDSEKYVFLHFPPVFQGYVCPELIEVMKRHGVEKAWFGHIHGLYDIPSEFTYDGIRFGIISADYLKFTPILIR